ncbi:MAG TPA: hypothetical protein VHB77_18225 [Planctomycetaceae bacterium]|nr:hypothetical protein [Planctomycetaceae bacterium]
MNWTQLIEKLRGGPCVSFPHFGEDGRVDRTALIEKLIRDTIQRAIREGIACVLLIVAFSFQLLAMPPGSLPFYGSLLILIGTGLIAVVLWSFTLSDRLLSSHPATDSAFWLEAFRKQARLLRLVPVWYLAPLCTGVLLMFAPAITRELPVFVVGFVVVALMFVFVTWLNRYAAAHLDLQAQAFATESPSAAG